MKWTIMGRLAALAMATLVGTLACGRDAATGSTPFDGSAALSYASRQIAFGPRVPGTEQARNAGDWIVAEMRKRADTVVVQTWNHTTAAGMALPMRNIIARFRPELSERILYVTHWDTRPASDGIGASAEQRLTPVPGANDGASGVALFLALSDILRKTPPAVGVDLLFVDGEDYGNFTTMEDVLVGSTYFAANPVDSAYRPIFGVLWDMIGDRDLRILREPNSMAGAGEVVQRVWATARSLGHANVFVDEISTPIIDDHIPLLRAGMRVIDVIDIEYAHHHLPSDTMDKISAESLKIVGDVALGLISGWQD